MSTSAVFKYLQDQNRPYSANDIVQNLGKDYGKTAVQKSLDELVRDEKIIEKIYGKQKVYAIIQENDDASIDKMKEDIQQMDVKFCDAQTKLKEVEEKLQVAQGELKKFQSSLSTREAREKRDELADKVKKLKTKLKELSGNKTAISNEEKTKIVNEHAKYVKEYRKRKRICVDIIESILESYPKSKKDLIADIGMETDEDVGFKLQC